MIKKLIYILFGLFLFVNNSFALQKIFIFHINGVNTSLDAARRNMVELNAAIGAQSNMIANNGQIDLLYNKEDGTSYCSLCKQLNDVFSQKKYENLTLDDYVTAYINDKKLNIKPTTPEYEALKASIKEKYFADPAFMGVNFTDILNQFHQKVPAALNTKYLTEYLAANTIKNGQKPFILLLPHSQGNLYANSLYKELTTNEGYNRNNLSIYGIASPAANNLGDYISQSAYGDNGYITSFGDTIINGLHILAAIPPQQTIAPANIQIPTALSDISGHSLIPIYLTNLDARQRIITNAYNILHYFWLSDIYSNFEQTRAGGERILSPGLSFVATQEKWSTLFIEGAMYGGNCINTSYFVVRDAKYDNEIGLGMQCVSGAHGTINLKTNAKFANTNQLKIRVAGKINEKLFSYELRPASPFFCQNLVKWNTLSGGFFSGIVGGINTDKSCEHDGHAELIYPGWPTRDQLFDGVVGNLQL